MICANIKDKRGSPPASLQPLFVDVKHSDDMNIMNCEFPSYQSSLGKFAV